MHLFSPNVLAEGCGTHRCEQCQISYSLPHDIQFCRGQAPASRMLQWPDLCLYGPSSPPMSTALAKPKKKEKKKAAPSWQAGGSRFSPTTLAGTAYRSLCRGAAPSRGRMAQTCCTAPAATSTPCSCLQEEPHTQHTQQIMLPVRQPTCGHRVGPPSHIMRKRRDAGTVVPTL